ncbi:hypothetical protein [Helicobacter himalayensis]|uniref:hypothetical protein n=1 Tax=Helicobacter himalayensis TaxID=1591088 RepID=UPI000B18FDCE|nr:hypothetical protein [Helicobacter himalayensis]
MIVFIFALFLRLYFAYKKDTFHIDESLSVAISANSGYMWGKPLPNGEFFGKELKGIAYWHDRSFADAISDIKGLWKNNQWDLDHPNLYYILYRLWHIGVQTGDFEWIKQRGIGLNLVFFAYGFIFAFFLARRLFGFNFLIPLFLALAFFNSASVSNTIFIREYALQEALALLFVLNLLLFFQNPRRGFWFLVYFAFCTALFLLSGYFTLFFVLPCVIVLLCVHFRNGLKIIFATALSFGFCKIFYQSYFLGLDQGGRSKQALDKLQLQVFFENLQKSFDALIDILHTHLINIFILVLLIFLCSLLLCKYKTLKKYLNRNLAFTLGVFIFSILWICGILYLAPYKTLRYIMPIFPFLFLGICVGILLLSYRIPKISVLLSLCFVGSLFYHYKLDTLKKSLPDSIFSQVKTPVVIHLPNWNWQWAYFLYQLNDLQLYTIESDKNKLKTAIADKSRFYFISSNGLPLENIEIIEQKSVSNGIDIFLLQNKNTTQ